MSASEHQDVDNSRRSESAVTLSEARLSLSALHNESLEELRERLEKQRLEHGVALQRVTELAAFVVKFAKDLQTAGVHTEDIPSMVETYVKMWL